MSLDVHPSGHHHSRPRNAPEAREAGRLQADAVQLGFWHIRRDHDGSPNSRDVQELAGRFTEQAIDHDNIEPEWRASYREGFVNRLRERL